MRWLPIYGKISYTVGAALTKFSLTDKQHAVFEFIQRYLSEHRTSPLIREIQQGCQIASYKSAIDRLNALEHKGFIKRVPNKHRGIKLVQRAPLDPAHGARPEPVEERTPQLQPKAKTPSLEGAGEGVPA